jgi:hypothetical protein
MHGPGQLWITRQPLISLIERRVSVLFPAHAVDVGMAARQCVAASCGSLTQLSCDTVCCEQADVVPDEVTLKARKPRWVKARSTGLELLSCLSGGL